MSQTKANNSYSDRYSPESESRYAQEYVYGNAAPWAEPERRRRQKKAPAGNKSVSRLKRERQQQRISRRNQQRALAMNMGYVLFLAAATIVCAVACLYFIGAQSTVTSSMEEVSELESRLEELQSENSVLENQIAADVNITTIKDRALGYGMVYPQEDQIVYYSVVGSDYMDQYDEVPAR